VLTNYLHERKGEIARFLIVGIGITVLGIINFAWLNKFFSYSYAYTIAFVIGLTLQFFLQTKVVFKTQIRVKRAPIFAITYVLQFLLTLALLWFFIDRLGMDSLLSMIIATAIGVPITFILNRLILVVS